MAGELDRVQAALGKAAMFAAVASKSGEDPKCFIGAGFGNETVLRSGN